MWWIGLEEGESIIEARLAMIRLLLEKGAPIDIKNKNGDTALSLALRYKNRKMACLLREYGAT